MIYPFTPTCVIVILALTVVSEVTAKSYEEDVAITPKEKATLEKFKEVVIPQIPETSIVHNYIKDDLYFIRWLRAGSFDIWAAEKMLLDHLKWREEQNMDTILEEDWSEFEKEFPIFTDTHDKEGRPAAEYWLGEFDVAKAASSGHGPQLSRWIITILEAGQRQLYEARAKGRKVSRSVVLIDLGGFSIMKNACTKCMTVYAEALMAYMSQYPDHIESIRGVNMSPVVDTVLSLVKLLLGSTYDEVIRTYGEKSEWEAVLDANFEKSQRSPRFGGTKSRDNLKSCVK